MIGTHACLDWRTHVPAAALSCTQVMLVIAEEEREGEWKMVAGSLNLIGSHALFGR